MVRVMVVVVMALDEDGQEATESEFFMTPTDSIL